MFFIILWALQRQVENYELMLKKSKEGFEECELKIAKLKKDCVGNSSFFLFERFNKFQTQITAVKSVGMISLPICFCFFRSCSIIVPTYKQKKLPFLPNLYKKKHNFVFAQLSLVNLCNLLLADWKTYEHYFVGIN